MLFMKSLLIILVLQALPFHLENLLEPELRQIRELFNKDAELKSKFPNGVEDPCSQYCELLDDFVTWYFKARKSRLTERQILEISSLGDELQDKLKSVFPERPGMFCVLKVVLL